MAIAGTVIAGLLLTAPTAGGATLNVTQTGMNSANCVAVACDLAKAFSIAGAGDTISIGAGTYEFSNPVTLAANRISVVGKPGPRPTLRFTGTLPLTTGLTFAGSEASLRHIRYETTNFTNGVTSTSVLTVDDAEFVAKAGGDSLSVNGANSVIRNSRFELAASGITGGSALAVGMAATNTRLSDLELTGSGAGGIIPSTLLTISGPGSLAERIDARNEGGNALAISSPIGADPPKVRRSFLKAANAGLAGQSTAVSVFGGGILTDSVARSAGSLASGVMVMSGTSKIRNVTAIASHPAVVPNSSTGLQVMPGSAVSVKNSILRGESVDVSVAPGFCTPDPFDPGGPCIPGSPAGDGTITHSNFRTEAGVPLNAASGNNQSADPRFSDATQDNFRPRPGSPLINAGTADPDNGTTDFDGKARKSGSAVDIGAYEFQFPLPRPRTPIDRGEVPPQRDLARPVLSGLRIDKKRIKAGRKATFTYSLNEPGTVVIAIQRASSGRRKGRSCVKPTRSNRRAKKCTRFTTVRTITRNAAAGANTASFKSRKTGKYRARFAATDAAGNVAQRRPTVRFSIVKR